MKRKPIQIILAASIAASLMLIGAFAIAAAADTPDQFSLTLNRAEQTVTVAGDGYRPGEALSLIAAYNRSPDFSGPIDYIDQLAANAQGEVSFTFPVGEDDWLGGNEYFVALNGVVQSEKLYATYAELDAPTRLSLRMRDGERTLAYDIDSAMYEFRSSNPSVARVSANGVVTPMRAGTTTISLISNDGSGLVRSIVVSVSQ
ncbi:MAG: Ig-like domain-containing protein [Clostridiales Family XIII bacterium]|jgi:hypothetical protein|nr:Ig-like domain-containing protein [Clostridiales Family XIII bacterium]